MIRDDEGHWQLGGHHGDHELRTGDATAAATVADRMLGESTLEH